MSYVQPIVSYCKPFKRPINYPKYKKDYHPNAHVWVFKAAIKANGEMIDEEITNMFNFILKDNASN
jgi:hypothetical protein